MRTETVHKTSNLDLHGPKQRNGSCCDIENLKQKKSKGMIARLLERLAKENEKSFGSTPPRCH